MNRITRLGILPICILAISALLLNPHPLLAQSFSTAGTARPKVKNEGRVWIAGGYANRYYLQEGKTLQDKDAHVFYEPLIYISDNEDHTLRYHINDGILTLYIRLHSEEDIIPTLRQKLINEAKQKNPHFELEPGTTHYRISVLEPSEVYFISAKDRQVKSSPLEASFTERGEIPIYFDMASNKKAESFVSDLNNNVSQLIFKYEFAGVADKLCIAALDYSAVQDLEMYNEIMGAGAPEFVSRDKYINLTDRIVENGLFRVRCGTQEKTDGLRKDLLAILGGLQSREVTSWKEVEKYVPFNEEDFKAAVVKEIRNTEEENSTKNQATNLVSNTKSTMTNKGVRGESQIGFGPWSAKVSADMSNSDSKVRKAVQNAVEQALSKEGINVRMEADRFVPKSVEGKSQADLSTALKKNITVVHSLPEDEDGRGSVYLTKDAWYSQRKTAPQEKTALRQVGEVFRDCPTCPEIVDHIEQLVDKLPKLADGTLTESSLSECN